MKYKKEIIITIVITLLVMLLRYINVLQIENNLGKIPVMIALIILISIVTIFIQKRIDSNHQKQKKSYGNIDLVKYIFAILILILHFRPFLNSSDQLDLAFNNIITRICVPFFFLVTGYFVAQKEKDNPNYIKTYIKNTIPLYLAWSVIYIPIIIGAFIENLPLINQYLISINLPIIILPILITILLPIILLIALVYTGIYYHLWYFPALILSLIVLDKWKKKFNIKYLLYISFILLLFGATETYYGFLPISIKGLIKYYYNIFFTTRNFLFFGLFYVVLGYKSGSKEQIYDPYCFVKLIVCFFLLIFEGIIVHDVDRLNSNILLSCVPLVYYLFISVLYIDDILKDKNKRIRALSKYYYLVHPAVIFFVAPILAYKGDTLDISVILLLLVILITHIISVIILKFKQKYPNLIV